MIKNPIEKLRKIKQKELEEAMANSIELEADNTPWYHLPTRRVRRPRKAFRPRRMDNFLRAVRAIKIILTIAFATWIVSLALGLTYQYKRVKNQTYLSYQKKELCADLNLANYHSYAAKKYQLEKCMQAYE